MSEIENLYKISSFYFKQDKNIEYSFYRAPDNKFYSYITKLSFSDPQSDLALDTESNILAESDPSNTIEESILSLINNIKKLFSKIDTTKSINVAVVEKLIIFKDGKKYKLIPVDN